MVHAYHSQDPQLSRLYDLMLWLRVRETNILVKVLPKRCSWSEFYTKLTVCGGGSKGAS